MQLPTNGNFLAIAGAGRPMIAESMAVAVIVALLGFFGTARTVALNLAGLRVFLGLGLLARGFAADFLFTAGDLLRSLLHASKLLAHHFANRRPMLVRGWMQLGPALADPLAQEL